MRTVSTKLREGEAAHFKELAGFYGVTRYEVISAPSFPYKILPPVWF